MAIIERHQSPDHQLTLVVELADGDWTIGFEGFPFHTHGDILARTEYPGTPEQATQEFVAEILQSRRPVVIFRVNGKIRDFGVPEKFDRARLQSDIAKYGLAGETFEARYWDGRAVAD